MYDTCQGMSQLYHMTRVVVSMSGHRVVNSPATSFYSATKFAVTALTEGLRKELRDIKSNIKITVRETACIILN